LAPFPIYRILEQIVSGRGFDFAPILSEIKRTVIPFLPVIVVTNLLGYFLLGSHQMKSFLGALAFTGLVGQSLLVNISVAELQPINVFSKEGFLTVASRTGFLTTLLTFIGLPLLIVYKLWKKETVKMEEIFLFFWAFVMFYSITRGIRFSLQFSIAASVVAGYVLGNIINYLKNRRVIEKSLIYGIVFSLIFVFVSTSIQMGFASKEMLISKNWYDMLDWLVKNADKDALIMTWWDPGHILAGYTYYKGKPLKVHADGAHCGPGACVPYDHNIRIQDMGRIFSISNEEEALEIIKKYANISYEECSRVYELHDGKVPEDACKPASEVYIIASSDLIGKYYWLSYFGTGKGRSFIQLQLTGIDTNGNFIYGGGMIALVQKNETLVPIINLPQQGIRNMIIEEIDYFDNRGEHRIKFSEYQDTIPGLVWVDPSFRIIIYMDQDTKNSLFSKMFFWNGEGLKHFRLVYSNPEARVFKVVF